MITFDAVSKRFPDGTVGAEGLSLEVEKGEVVVLVGPSGCGKTTTMRMVNRMVEPRCRADSASGSASPGRSQPIPLMLMDEPFAAVDPIVRALLQQEFLRLQAAVRKTIVFVTHDIDEAVTMGDRVAILSQGGRLTVAGDGTVLGWAWVAEVIGQVADAPLRQFRLTVNARDSLRAAFDAMVSSRTGVAVRMSEANRYEGIVTHATLAREIA